MDPISLALAGISLGKSFYDSSQAKGSAQKNIAQQQAMLANAIMQAQSTSNDRMKVAGAQKTDQFGNTTQYDPSTGRWVTVFTPEQQKLIDQGQQRQERTNLRGAQASEDYNTQRSGYLNLRPKSEAETYAEIARLITQSQGEGDRALAKMVDRQELRQRGNMPVINTGPLAGSTAGQRLADTMLKARSQALAETGQRQQMHSAEYLPAMAAFEKTANTVGQVDPTGSGIIGMAQQGSKDVQDTYGDLTKAMMSIYGTGAGATNAASNALTQASMPKNELSQFAALIKSLQPNAAQIKANAANAPVEPQISGTTYTADGSPTSSSGGGYSFNPSLTAFDTPSEFTYDAPQKQTFNDRWYF